MEIFSHHLLQRHGPTLFRRGESSLYVTYIFQGGDLPLLVVPGQCGCYKPATA